MPRPRKIPPLADGVLAESDGSRTTKQAAFIAEYVANGGKATDAAIAAGYAQANEGYRLLANPLIQQEILKETLSRLGMAAPQALSTVMRLSEGARSEYVQLQAAQDLLDRAGFRPPDRVDHRVDASLTVTFDIAPDPKILDG